MPEKHAWYAVRLTFRNIMFFPEQQTGNTQINVGISFRFAQNITLAVMEFTVIGAWPCGGWNWHRCIMNGITEAGKNSFRNSGGRTYE